MKNSTYKSRNPYTNATGMLLVIHSHMHTHTQTPAIKQSEREKKIFKLFGQRCENYSIQSNPLNGKKCEKIEWNLFNFLVPIFFLSQSSSLIDISIQFNSFFWFYRRMMLKLNELYNCLSVYVCV